MCNSQPHDIHRSKYSYEYTGIVGLTCFDGTFFLKFWVIRVSVVADGADSFYDVRKLDKQMKQLDKTCSGILLAFIDGECHNHYPVLTLKMNRQ